MTQCGRNFPEEYLSGYLDGVLTQENEQRVRLHLEDCEACAAEWQAMGQNREATMSTEFETEDLQWDETPRSGVSRVLRNLGLFLLFLYLLSVLALSLWQPEETDRLWTRAMVAFGVLGIGCLTLRARTAGCRAGPQRTV